MKRKRLLFLLALLMTVATGAWADGQELKVKIISEEMATPWLQDDGSTMLAAKDLPGFCPATEDEAMAWADVPQEGTVCLIYAFDDPDEGSAVHYVMFVDGNYAGSSQQDESIYSIAYAITDQGVKFFYTWAPTYTVKLADGTQDAKSWTIASGDNSVKGDAADGLTGLSKGDAVTLTYGGRLKVKNVTATTAPEPDPLATPLTIEAITDGTIQVSITDEEGSLTTLQAGMKYSVNGGTPTTIYESTNIPVAKDDKVQFYGNGKETQVYGIDAKVRILGIGDGFKTNVYGNIMSLLDETGFATKTDLPNASYVFARLFQRNATLIDASELLLPAAKLTTACYQQMFEGCTSLITAPKLPATTLAAQCYSGMFSGCTSLTSAYVKAAYTGEYAECRNMFNYCTASGAVLHTTSGSKESWENMMGSGKTWSAWSVATDWQD